MFLGFPLSNNQYFSVADRRVLRKNQIDPKMRTCLAISTIFLSGSTLANSNNEKFSIYPEVYQNVFNDDNNANSINSQSAQTGFDNIYETVNEDLKHTTQCINSLTLDQAKECHTKGQKYVEANLDNGWPFISFGKRDFLAKARFRNIFVPQYIEKTLGMMIFDASFKYFGEFGFHEHAVWTIDNCAKLHCENNSTKINKELVAANTKYNKKNAEGLAGNHYGIDWSKMVETYNVNGLASPSDNYNLWMPGLEEGEQKRTQYLILDKKVFNIPVASSFVISGFFKCR